MTEFLVVILVALGFFFFGSANRYGLIHEKCVAKYSYMPHNQVDTHCKELLLFKNETK